MARTLVDAALDGDPYELDRLVQYGWLKVTDRLGSKGGTIVLETKDGTLRVELAESEGEATEGDDQVCFLGRRRERAQLELMKLQARQKG